MTTVLPDSDRIAEYDMKLMDIDTDQLGIPDTEYDARITMPAAEFTRIVRDLSLLGESVRIEVSKEGIRFTSEGEAANGNVLLKHSDGKIGKIGAKSESDEAEGGRSAKVKEEKDEDVEMDEEQEQEFQANSGDEGKDDDEDEDGESKKRKKKVRRFLLSSHFSLTGFIPKAEGTSKPSKKAKTKKPEDEDDQAVNIEMNQHVSLTFSLKYLVNFSKSASLAVRVQLMMSNDVPLLVMHRPVDRCVYSYEIHYRFPMILTRVLFVTILHPKSVMTDVLPSAVLCCLSACCSFFAQSTCHHLSQDCLFRRIPLQSFFFHRCESS